MRGHSASVWRSVGSALVGKPAEKSGLLAVWTVRERSHSSHEVVP